MKIFNIIKNAEVLKPLTLSFLFLLSFLLQSQGALAMGEDRKGEVHRIESLQGEGTLVMTTDPNKERMVMQICNEDGVCEYIGPQQGIPLISLKERIHHLKWVAYLKSAISTLGVLTSMSLIKNYHKEIFSFLGNFITLNNAKSEEAIKGILEKIFTGPQSKFLDQYSFLVKALSLWTSLKLIPAEKRNKAFHFLKSLLGHLNPLPNFQQAKALEEVVSCQGDKIYFGNINQLFYQIKVALLIHKMERRSNGAHHGDSAH